MDVSYNNEKIIIKAVNLNASWKYNKGVMLIHVEIKFLLPSNINYYSLTITYDIIYIKVMSHYLFLKNKMKKLCILLYLFLFCTYLELKIVLTKLEKKLCRTVWFQVFDADFLSEELFSLYFPSPLEILILTSYESVWKTKIYNIG